MTERVEVPANNSKLNIGKLLKSLVTNRSLLGIIAAAIALLLAMLTMQGMAGYVFLIIMEMRLHSLCLP